MAAAGRPRSRRSAWVTGEPPARVAPRVVNPELGRMQAARARLVSSPHWRALLSGEVGIKAERPAGSNGRDWSKPETVSLPSVFFRRSILTLIRSPPGLIQHLGGESVRYDNPVVRVAAGGIRKPDTVQSSTTKHEELLLAVRTTVKELGRPAEDVQWKPFCDSVRERLGKKDNSRGYGDKSIVRAYTSIYVASDKLDK